MFQSTKDMQEKLNNQILPFEMNNSITDHQKKVLLKEAKRILDIAAANRDALEVVDIQRMEKRINEIRLREPINLFDYLKEIFIESQLFIFTLFDILGITLFFFPQIAQLITNDLTLVRSIGIFIFFFMGKFQSLQKISLLKIYINGS